MGEYYTISSMMRFLNHILIIVFLAFTSVVKAQNCHSNFSFQVNNSISPFTYDFIDLSTSDGIITNWEWDFGEGQSSFVQNPEHQYLEDGKYYVSLKITTDNQCTSTFSDTITIQKVLPPTCQAYFTVVKLTSSPDYTYKFTDHSVFTNDSIVSWLWNFGDMSSSNLQHPIHQYVNPGNFNTSLQITTATGCTSSFNYQLSIYSGSAACNASFSYNHDSLSGNPLKYHFHDNSYSNASIISWKWDFGDGDSSNLQDPDHVFPFQGFYYIKLKITNVNGCTDSMFYPIKVGTPQQYNLWGRVYAGNYVIDKCIAYLYKEYYNDLYIPIDTVRLTSVNDTLGVYYFYQILEGKHKVKVLLPDNSIFMQDFAPTYYGNNYDWASAGSLNLISDISMANINLEKVVASGGSNKISGKVISLDNDVKPNEVEIILLSATNEIIAYTFSDSAGNFSFNNVQNGSMFVIGEITGIDFVECAFYLDGNDTISNLVLKIENKRITGINQAKEIAKNLNFRVYPIPAKEIVNIEKASSSNMILNFIITDLSGKVLKTSQNSGSETLISLDISGLARGIYLLNLLDIEGNALTTKKFIKI